MKFHIFHNWSKWSDPIDTHTDYRKLQSRYCTECNKVEVKKISQPFNIWFHTESFMGKKK
jgi:hypothetical protein